MKSSAERAAMQRKGWIITAIICLIVSIVSLFITIIKYTGINGVRNTYNILDFIDYQRFADEVLTEYSGSMFLSVEDSTVRIFAMIGVIAIVLAVIGIFGMSLQKRNTWSFVLTLLGLVGTLIPSIVIILAVVLSREYFQGTLSCGLYPIITPIAMIICIITVSWKRKKTKEELEAERIAGQFLRRGSDL